MTGKGESREEEALRRFTEATLDGFRRGRGPGNVRIVVEDRADGRREIDVDDGRGGQPATPIRRP